MLSPTRLEETYVARERSLYAWCAHRSFAWNFAIVVALGFFVNFVHAEIASLHPWTQSLFYIFPYVSNSILLILASSLIFIRLPIHALRYTLPAFSLGLSVFAGYIFLKPEASNWSATLSIAFIPVVLTLAGIYISLQKRQLPKAMVFTGYTLLHFGWVFGVLTYLQSLGLFSAVAYLFGFKCVLFWFWVCARTRKGNLTLFELSLPMNALRAWPWPSPERELISETLLARKIVWWNGFFNILLGYALFSGVAILMLHFADSYQGLLMNYGMHVLVDVGTLNLIIGGARLFGFNLIDGTFFSFLAKSPTELWRRGSVYNFKFNQEFVFWPAIRIVKNYWIALFVAFSMFYLNALTYESVITLIGDPLLSDEVQSRLETARALSFALHFGLICLPPQIWRFRYLNLTESGREWAGVIATHACSLTVLYISYSLVVKILHL